jgi:hypothetical protein
MDTQNYYSVAQLTEEEQVSMYMKLSKREIIDMLIQANRVIDTFVKPTPVVMDPYKNVPESHTPTCKSWGDCMNPFMDCINCPVRGYTLSTNNNLPSNL